MVADSVATLMAPVDGMSGSLSLDVMAQFVHIACFAVRAALYLEYVESDCNWADEDSRDGPNGS